MNKGTNLELFEKVLGQLSGDVKKEFEGYVEKYEAKNARVAEKRKEKADAINAELLANIKSVLSKDTAMTRDQILNKLSVKVVGGKAVTAQKISTLLGKVDFVNATEIKIDGKKSKAVAYTLA